MDSFVHLAVWVNNVIPFIQTEPVGYVVTRFTAIDNDLGPAGEFIFSMTQSVPDLDNGVTNACMCNCICIS